jgi:hypothetical protein
MQPGGALAGLRPTQAKWWHFIFVVPPKMASTYKSQNLDGDTGRGEWAGKVHQYVLGLKEGTIFGRSDSSGASESPSDAGISTRAGKGKKEKNY